MLVFVLAASTSAGVNYFPFLVLAFMLALLLASLVKTRLKLGPASVDLTLGGNSDFIIIKECCMRS